jgi:hypothetical protein
MLDSLHILVNLLNAAVECRAAEELQRLRQLRPQRVSYWSGLARGGVEVMVSTYRLNESPLSIVSLMHRASQTERLYLNFHQNRPQRRRHYYSSILYCSLNASEAIE